MDGILTSKEAVRLYMKKFSTNLKKIREKKGLTQAEMAKNCHMDLSNYRKYETGSRENVTIETILKFSSALEMEPKDFFDFKFDKEKYKIAE